MHGKTPRVSPPPADEWFNSVHPWRRNSDGNEESTGGIFDEVRHIDANNRPAARLLAGRPASRKNLKPCLPGAFRCVPVVRGDKDPTSPQSPPAFHNRKPQARGDTLGAGSGQANVGCLSLLTMPLISDSDCDGEHNFPLWRFYVRESGPPGCMWVIPNDCVQRRAVSPRGERLLSSGGLSAHAGQPPKTLAERLALPPRKFVRKLIGPYPSPIPFRGWSGGPVASYTQWEIGLGPAAKGRRRMTRSVHTATLVVLLCLPVLALSDLAAWAKHHRMGPYFSQPCPDRCNSTRLSICSACMGGTKTCAQQHVCSNNRSVVCGDESTVTVPCWNQRYRW
jgi:hypothetical protein